MKEKAPTRKQELNLDRRGSDHNKNPAQFHTDQDNKNSLHELARKWVRFGIADTPNEALKMLQEGM